MAVTKLDKQYASFTKDDILVDRLTDPDYALKVLKEVWIEALGEYRLILQYGSVRGGTWKGDTNYSTGAPDLTLYTPKNARANFVGFWKPGEEVNSGDVLKDEKGKMYLVKDKGEVWCLESGTHAGLAYWKGEGRTFTQVQTASRNNFSKHIKIS
ncbi:hypothetical protein SEA_ZOOBEAR_83 [Streptomyces phage ZooBear]|uniref:Uncharacterized protein n=2 Tax=Immanueltrevirus immanuel3 TaxID=2846399 RepID=A0A2H5BM45_9CAUD|nr:hypothetical protein SEA_HAUGEANATOR_83 [Streptomyces phage HaugeAnator]AUG87644.1 hypothetical protein SEA_ZOOBEAR_83 [Streptomyces phage ZooBear]